MANKPLVFTRVQLDTRNLDKMTGELEARAEQVLDKVAAGIESDWKDYIIAQNAIDTGAYLNSIGVEPNHGRLQRDIGDNVEYGVYVEYGTRFMPARPCMQPAVENQRASMVKAWKELFK